MPGLHDVSNNQLKRADVQGVRLTFKYNLCEIQIYRPPPKDFLSVPHILSSSSVTGELAIRKCLVALPQYDITLANKYLKLSFRP